MESRPRFLVLFVTAFYVVVFRRFCQWSRPPIRLSSKEFGDHLSQSCGMEEIDRGDMVECPANLGDIAEDRFYNEDIAPTSLERRTWDKWHIAALWVGMSVCVPTYMLASSLVQKGMNWKAAIGTVFLANLLVLVPMILNAHAGTKFGIPFPVYCRTAFGLVGANVPALMRGLVACGWFGIQTWIGGSAIYEMMASVMPSITQAGNLPLVGENPWKFFCFLLFWAINMAIVYRGIDSIQFLEKWGAPFLIFIGFALLLWAYITADGFGPMLSEPGTLNTWGEFMAVFAPGLTANVSFWATLSLNIPDFTRFAKSQRDQVLGQTMGLPPTMTAFAFIGVAVTSATVVIFGDAIWDPIVLLGKIGEGKPFVVFLSMSAFAIATLTTNLAANVVSPANDFAHLAPQHISFRTGGMITGVLGIFICPWYLLAQPDAYIFTWLGGYGSLLGSIGGVLLVEYWIIQRRRLELEDLYRSGGKYPTWRPTAIAAFFLGAAPCVPGFLHTIGVVEAPQFFQTIYGYSIFVSAGTAALLHLVLSLGRREPA